MQKETKDAILNMDNAIEGLKAKFNEDGGSQSPLNRVVSSLQMYCRSDSGESSNYKIRKTIQDAKAYPNY